jgi:iron complex transport system ATP-binding protein
VLRGVDLALQPGELVCLMGVNGCGKSTLLDCALGVSAPSAGHVLLDGAPVGSHRPAQIARRLAYVPQVHDRSFPYLAEQIVLMGRTAHQAGLGSPGADDLAIARASLERCGIGHLAARPYTQLSGGEMQMVMLARALAQETSVILMDEPTAHLDFKNELLFLETVVGLIREQSASILMATHSPNHAFYFENRGLDVRVAMMHEGRIHAEGHPGDVLRPELIAELYDVEVSVLEGVAVDGSAIRQLVPIRSANAAAVRGGVQ